MLDSCDPIDAGADDLAPKAAESTPAETVPPEVKANAADVAQAAAGKDAAEAQTDLMLAIAMVVQQPAPEGKEAPVEGAADEIVADEAQSEADPSLQQAAASGDAEALAAAQPAPLPAAVPVPAAIPTAGEATVGAPDAESIPATSAVIEAKAATSPAVPAAEIADAKTATPAGQAEAALVASAGRENTQKSGQPLSTAETPPDDKAAAPVASTPATDAEAAAQKAANRSADAPAAAAPQRETNTPDTKPIAAAPPSPSPEITANSAAVPAPVATNAVAQHAAQPSAHQPGPKDAVPVAGLAVEIAAHAQAGKTHFEIRLDPPELGRIDVRLDVDSDGQVTSHLRVERPETLDLLRRDAPALERALQQAGLKTSDSGLQFSLRDQAFSQRDQGRDMPAMAHVVVPDEKLAPVETQRHYGRLTGLGSGVDIRV